MLFWLMITILDLGECFFIEANSNKEIVAEFVYRNFLLSIINDINNDHTEDAIDKYQSMVEYLENIIG
jgi:hypothetical protein